MTPVKATLWIVAAAAGLLLAVGEVAAQSPDLPEGPGKSVVAENCSVCHGTELITAQRRTPQEWAGIVDRMVGNGAVLTEEQYKAVVAYLGTYMSTAGATAAAPPAH